MPTKWLYGLVQQIEDVTPTTRIFYLEIENVERFEFQPGQFITLDLPISEKRLGRWRSYSIANAPNASNLLELCIVNLEGGAGTDYLFNEINIGDKLKFKGPDGMFVLPKDLSNELVLICTGTGVAPFRSMIHYAIQNEKDFNNIHLIFGTRTFDQILYLDEFKNLAREHPNFKYDVCLSREEITTDHEGIYHQGYVHSVYLNKYKKRKENRMFLICGWSKMIDQAVAHLMIDLKYKPSQIKYELYG